jgi:hypothetical protein
VLRGEFQRRQGFDADAGLLRQLVELVGGVDAAFDQGGEAAPLRATPRLPSRPLTDRAWSVSARRLPWIDAKAERVWSTAVTRIWARLVMDR